MEQGILPQDGTSAGDGSPKKGEMTWPPLGKREQKKTAIKTGSRGKQTLH